jgi:acid phosphatase
VIVQVILAITMFNKQTLSCLAGALAVASAATSTVNRYPSTAEVEAAAATVQPESPTSNVHGLAFNRFVNIWFENTDYDKTETDPVFTKLASEGILLSNYWAVTHPSEPNYCSSAGGENFGMDNDDWYQIPANVSTIADLFDTKHISWYDL